jgi:DNA-binding XRE family transcriptional regulator
MTQGQLAEYLRVRQATVSMLESDELEPSDGLAEMIERWLASGAGPRKKSERGPYKTRSTLPE